ncbi:hypothetical protein B0H17DRAFT_1214682 [Mycena rosella]|uniref:Uncharacterized protein n=1 Tax=Mycena rosella TaxID=1033263 RepID=A0AAD7G460_MYCRO|nr:hypothetical protein B0H17DRAFT_1214682 [Mycena rosella]
MAIISLQETQRLFGAAIRPADDTNVRHHAIMRKALETYPMRNGTLVVRETDPPSAEVRQALRAYCEAYDAYFKQRGNEYAVRDPQALIQLQAAEQTWHDWVVRYRASRGMPGRPYWALEPLPGLQRVQLQLQPAAAPVPPATPRRRAGRSFFPLPTPPPSSPVRPSHPSSPVRPSHPTPRKRPPSQINFLGVIDISDDDEEASRPRKKSADQDGNVRADGAHAGREDERANGAHADKEGDARGRRTRGQGQNTNGHGYEDPWGASVTLNPAAFGEDAHQLK